MKPVEIKIGDFGKDECYLHAPRQAEGCIRESPYCDSYIVWCRRVIILTMDVEAGIKRSISL